MSNPIVIIKTTSGLSDSQSINDYNNLRRGELGYDYTNDKLYIGHPSNVGSEGKLLNPKDYFSSFSKNNYTLTLTTKDGMSYAQTLPDLYVSGWTWAGGTTNGPTATITIKDASGIIADKTVSVGAIPSASDSASGIVTKGNQWFGGNKHFTGNLYVGAEDIFGVEPLEDGAVIAAGISSITMGDGYFSINVNAPDGGTVLEIDPDQEGLHINSLGWSSKYISNAYLTNASINTLTVNNSLTATAFKIKNGSYSHSIVSQAASSNKTMTIANDTGFLAYVPGSTAVGGTSTPIFANADGKLQACTQVGVPNGGTGLSTLAAGYIPYGDGTKAMKSVPIGAKGAMLISDGTKPTYVTPTLALGASTSTALSVKLVTNLGDSDATVALPEAQSNVAGIMTANTQTFAGAKTFSNLMTLSAGITVTGTSTFNSGMTVKNTIAMTAGSITHSSALTMSATNNLTLQAGSSANLSLKGGKLVLDSSMYGTADPPTPTVEGQVYFKIIS